MKEDNGFSRRIAKSAQDLAKGRNERGRFWHYASVVGMGGWLFVIPVVAGAYLGRYMDATFKAHISWTITFIILGIVAGMYNVWYFLIRKMK